MTSEDQNTPKKGGFRNTERWKGLVGILHTYYDDQWWNIFFSRPAATLCLYPIADIPWVTPNLLTYINIPFMVAFVVACGIGTPTAFLVAAVLNLIVNVIDAMDGHLARYRKMSSQFGAYMDKTLDHIRWAATFITLGWVTMEHTGSMVYLFLGIITALAITLKAYIWWIWRVEVRKVPEASFGTFWVQFFTEDEMKKKGESNPTPENPRFWDMRNHLRILEFAEPDLHFYLSLFLVLNRIDIMLWFVALTQGGYTLLRVVQRGVNCHRLDMHTRAKTSKSN